MPLPRQNHHYHFDHRHHLYKRVCFVVLYISAAAEVDGIAASVCVPRSDVVSILGDTEVSGNTVSRKSANTFICALGLVSSSGIFLRNLTHFLYGCFSRLLILGFGDLCTAGGGGGGGGGIGGFCMCL